MATSSSNTCQSTQQTSCMDFSSLAKTLHFNLPIKLDESNYIYWKTQILPAINALDLEISDESGGIRVEQHLNPEFQKWKKSDQILLFWLISTLSQKVVGQVTKCKSALEAWTKLQNLYSQKSMAKILNLSDFVLKIKNIGDALSAAGEEVSERDLLLSLMHGVGHEYDSVVVLISSQRSTMSLEEAQFLLLMHEQRIEELNSPIALEIKLLLDRHNNITINHTISSSVMEISHNTQVFNKTVFHLSTSIRISLKHISIRLKDREVTVTQLGLLTVVQQIT
ncbi:hypothetical protein ACOSQ4_023006 [Xanthoceras sorbifolium]